MASNLENDCSEVNSSSDLQSLADNSPDTIIPESDNDSGIVAIANSNRIGSTASNSDEDNIFKDKLNQSTNHPFHGSKPRVRFDDELPLSEQNMRKSCKKLFETLWHQNKDIIGLKEESNSTQPSLLPSCHCHHFTQTLPQLKTNSQCCTHSDHNTSGDTNDSYDGNELLLTNYGQQCNYIRDVPLNRQQKCKSLDFRQNRKFWNLERTEDPIENKSFKKKVFDSVRFDCDDALDRIKRMSDQLESSSMVNAFARPAFIKSAEFGQTMDTLYETIFPTEKTTVSSNNHVKQWLNKVEAYDKPHEEVVTPVKDKENDPKLPNKVQNFDQNQKRPILKEIHRINNSLTPTKSSYISADQIYPDLSEDDITNEELNKSFEENRNNRFSSSYSAGDDNKRGILRHRIKSAVSEFDLTQKSSPKSKGFLQRFKTALSRAFTTDKITKQSVLDVNTLRNSKSLSQSDLRVDVNLRSSRTSIVAENRSRVDRSPSFVKNLRTRMSFRRNKESPIKSNDRMGRSNSQKNIMADNKNKPSNRSKSQIGSDSSVWGELIKLNSDSSQVIQINRQKGRAFGFFVARGTVNNTKGVFISRMKDEETQKSLTGVLEIGDEILAIDGESVKEANIMRVNQLITNKDTIRLTIVPYMNNKYL